MTTPKWQPGHLYAPGALVQPVAGLPVSQPPIANPGFETGDATGWTLGANMSINGYGRYAGLWALQLDTGVNTGPLGQEAVNSAEVSVNPGQKITARCMIHQGASSVGNAGGWVRVKWYDSAHAFISNSDGNNVKRGDGGAIHPSTVAAVAPAGAAYARIAGVLYRVNQNFVANADEFSWDYSTPAIPAGLIYKAVQPATGTSSDVEPDWPLVLGVTVVDNEVTWEAVQANRVIWEASPIMLSGATEPAWPTQPGGFVADNTISWECISRRVEDPKCPNSKVVAIIAGKVYAADGDITRFSATANPLDWSSPDDAGYLPTGLQQANANDIAVLNQYRSNLVALNASSFQNWQVDPNPAAMAILDQMDGIGSVWQQAAVSVGNELFYLTALGVRTVGIAAGAENLAAGDVGAPIDALVQAALAVPGIRPLATYYPGAGQYWLAMRAPLPVIAGPTITGSAPDGIEGVAYAGFAYTVTPGDGSVVSVEISDGSLPPTVSMDGAGVLDTAVTTTAGDYLYDVYALDTNGLSFTHPDSVTVLNALGNYWNPADTDSDITLSNANRTATSLIGGHAYQKTRGFNARSTGKWYFEVQGTFHPDNYDNGRVGVDPPAASLSSAVGAVAGSYAIQSNGYRQEGGVFNSTQMAAPLPGNRVIQVAWDADTGNLWYGVDGMWAFSGDPAAGTNPSSTGVTGAKLPAASMVDGEFAFNYTISTTPGQCSYTPPSGFSRWYP